MAPGVIESPPASPVDSVGVVDGINKPVVNGAAKAPKEEFDYPELATPYRVLPQYHSKPAKLRVACVGAGASRSTIESAFIATSVRNLSRARAPVRRRA